MNSETAVSYQTLHGATTHFTLKKEAVWNSETVVSYHKTTRCHNSLHPEEGCSIELWNGGVLPQDYTAPQLTSPWRRMQYGTLKRWCPATTLHGATTHFTLKKDAVWTSETVRSYHNTPQRHNSEELDMNLHSLENPKSRMTCCNSSGIWFSTTNCSSYAITHIICNQPVLQRQELMKMEDEECV
jgi:hypothetical protein